jgi:hypothetical protein
MLKGGPIVKFELEGITFLEEEKRAWGLHMETMRLISTALIGNKLYGFNTANGFAVISPVSCQERGFYIKYEDLLLLDREVVNFYA